MKRYNLSLFLLAFMPMAVAGVDYTIDVMIVYTCESMCLALGECNEDSYCQEKVGDGILETWVEDPADCINQNLHDDFASIAQFAVGLFNEQVAAAATKAGIENVFEWRLVKTLYHPQPSFSSKVNKGQQCNTYGYGVLKGLMRDFLVQKAKKDYGADMVQFISATDCGGSGDSRGYGVTPYRIFLRSFFSHESGHMMNCGYHVPSGPDVKDVMTNEGCDPMDPDCGFNDNNCIKIMQNYAPTAAAFEPNRDCSNPGPCDSSCSEGIWTNNYVDCIKCELKAAKCDSNEECCSGKCTGKPGKKTCA
jgi:hypothetical protein